LTSDVVIAVLAFGHILSAIAWLGGGLLTGFVIGPSLRNIAPTAALEFNAKVIPKVLRFIQAALGLTFLFGLLLLYYFSDGDLSWLMNSTHGYVLSSGILVAVVTAIVAMAFVFPAFRQVARISSAALQSGQPPAPEMMKYGKRARMGSMMGVALLLFVLATMVISGFVY
jgi:uncharacterized membrane protein